jgi:hypothetical protein
VGEVKYASGGGEQEKVARARAGTEENGGGNEHGYDEGAGGDGARRKWRWP